MLPKDSTKIILTFLSLSFQRLAAALAGQRLHRCLPPWALLPSEGLPGRQAPVSQRDRVPDPEDPRRPFASRPGRGQAGGSDSRGQVSLSAAIFFF